MAAKARRPGVCGLLVLVTALAAAGSSGAGPDSHSNSTPKFGPTDAVGIVSDFVGRNPSVYGVPPDEVRVAVRARDFVTAHNGVRHLTFQQCCRGVPIFGARLRASVTRRGEVVSLGSTMLPRPVGDFQVPGFVITAQEAVELAACSVGVETAAGLQPLTKPIGPQARQQFSQNADFTGPIGVQRVYFPLTRVDLRSAWKVVLRLHGGGQVYEIVVDAVDGAVLWRYDRMKHGCTEDVTLRIYPYDSPAPGSPGTDAPDGYQFPFAPDELRTVSAAEMVVASPDGWIDDGASETQGNNVDAHTDLNADDQPDLPRPEGTSYRVFDYLSDHVQDDPEQYRKASVVQLFYLCNVYHDRLYALGFDEAAGNFQLDNFDNGGVGGDRVLAQAQDGSANNLAGFATGAEDGSPALLEMHVFTGPTPDRDSAFDADLVFHELSHGLVTRLLGDLTGAQPEALAEGWCDFVAIALNAEDGDDPDGTYPFGAFVAYQYHLWADYDDNYYFGLRRFPYCTGHDKNPQTYADIDPAQQAYPAEVPRNLHVDNTADAPHNAGEVWCSALMQCRANLMDRYGFAGNEIMLQLVVDGMKLAVGNPTFLQARDAILQADVVNNGGVNQNELWQGFADRGMGHSAVSPSTAAAGVVEAFDVPFAVQFAYPDGLPELVPPDDGATFAVEIYGLGGAAPVPGSGRITYSMGGGAPVTVDLEVVAGNSYLAHLPPADCASTYAFYFSVDEPTLGCVTDPPAAPAEEHRAVAATSSYLVLDHDFEAGSGWTGGVPEDDATEGIWNRMDPEATIAQPEDDHTASPGTVCWVTEGLAGSSDGRYDVDGGQTTLVSPTFAIAGADAVVSYWRWFSNDAGGNPNEDVFTVWISNDGGGSWHIVETVGPTGPECSGGWLYHEFFVGDIVTPSDEMKMRFVAEDRIGSSLVEAAVDDFAVTEFDCFLDGDFDSDGDVDLDDHVALTDCLAGPAAGPAPTPPTTDRKCRNAFDFDADQDVDLNDAGVFASVFGAL